ncbi:Lipase 4 [Psilocybe cubensis]|uniref:Lipase 4 n=2 Tax=Psilocybe cubensis TaxID=181762 RepID=A0ACB8HGA6_PSICU|nr:Lipase 4 [Psilocybe cubensis]KAH9486199.1 Lipase 4 [Psilocybe cubensis]
MLFHAHAIAPLLLIYGAVSTHAATSAPIVNLGYAKYQGEIVQDQTSNATHTRFLGIRFAAPPTGAARFREPRPPAPLSGIQQSSPPPICYQASLSTGANNPYGGEQSLLQVREEGGRISEDCLFLNVFVPGGGLKEKANLPVIVWIHGGGYVGGGSWNSTLGNVYNGGDVIRRAGEGVIVVSIQYRMGLFGFLSGQKAKEAGVLNAGLLDQQFALQWVQKHINKFGGDPRKVTIWGESAGAGSVFQHVVANGGKTNPPLFKAAITSSLYLPPQYRYNDPIPEAIYDEVVRETKCDSSSDTLNCLRQIDAEILGPINFKVNDKAFFGTNAFVPVIDGKFIKDLPSNLLKQKKLNGDFVYAVTNTNEGTIFVNPSTADTLHVGQFLSQFYPTLVPEEISALEAKYSGLGSNFSQAVSIVGESIFICPTYRLLSAFGGKGYKAEFAIPPANHGEDVNYYFPDAFQGFVSPVFNNSEFQKAFAESFTNFAIYTNPNKKWESNITPLWNPWAGSNEIHFNKTEDGSPDVRAVKTSSSLLERCRTMRLVLVPVNYVGALASVLL